MWFNLGIASMSEQKSSLAYTKYGFIAIEHNGEVLI